MRMASTSKNHTFSLYSLGDRDCRAGGGAGGMCADATRAAAAMPGCTDRRGR